MKVLIVSRGLPQPDNPTFGIFELDQARALEKSGVDVVFFAIDLRSIRRKRKFGISKTVNEGIRCYTISIPVGNVPANMFCQIGRWALNKLYDRVFIRETPPDIIHAHFFKQGYMASDLARKTGIPLVITEHSSDMTRDRISNKILNIAKEGYSQASAVIAVGNDLSRSILKNTGIKCTIIPNVVDTSLFAYSKLKEHGGYRFISVARFAPQKRQDMLIKAFHKVHCQHPDAVLELYGDGELMPKVKELVKDYELQNVVSFHGRTSRIEIAEGLTQADCFVLLSERETFGVAYIEALAAGVPAIATICHGPEDFMTPEFGKLIHANNTEEAVDAMNYMYNHSSDFDREKISIKIKEMYSGEVIAAQIKCVYKRILKDKK